MASETIYPKGASVFLPHVKAPEFVKYNISIEPKQFIAFMSEHKQYMSEKGYFKFTIKEGSKGPYLSLDTYKPEAQAEPQSREMQDGKEYHSPIHDAVGGYPAGPDMPSPF